MQDRYCVHPIGWVESSLIDRESAPKQCDEGVTLRGMSGRESGAGSVGEQPYHVQDALVDEHVMSAIGGTLRCAHGRTVSLAV
jgi:hypothetical protein